MSALRRTTVWREPLVHFLFLGLLLFAIDRVANPAVDDDRVIVVDEGVRQMLVEKFNEGRGRAPTAEDYEDLVRLWAKNEVMYREALRLGLDRGDDMIRSRVILKMRNLVFGNIVVGEPAEGELQAWLEAHRDRYDRPRRVDFEQVRLPDGSDPQQALAAAQAAGRRPQAAYRKIMPISSGAIAAAAVPTSPTPSAAASPTRWPKRRRGSG